MCLWVLLCVHMRCWLEVVMTDSSSLFLLSQTPTLTHEDLPWVPISMHHSIGALYSSSYIIQIWIRDCQLADDPAPKCNSLDKNSLDSTLLWFSEFLTHWPPNVTSCFILRQVVLCRRCMNAITPLTCAAFSLLLVNNCGGLLNQCAGCFLWLCLPVCMYMCLCNCSLQTHKADSGMLLWSWGLQQPQSC